MMALSARSSLNEASIQILGFRGTFFYFGASMGPTVLHARPAAANSRSPINVLRVLQSAQHKTKSRGLYAIASNFPQNISVRCRIVSLELTRAEILLTRLYAALIFVNFIE
jgi:hypothetical protein